MTDHGASDSLLVHLQDLQRQSEERYMHEESFFLNEAEQLQARTVIPESDLVHYDGGYQGARKKKVIFLRDEEDDFSDIVCLCAEVDQRFRRIGHRDILGALMHLQIDRHSFGDFWLEKDHIYLYTSDAMGTFLVDNFTRIASLNVSFRKIEEHPVQVFHTRTVHVVMASERADAVVAALVHCSRSKAKEMIRAGLVAFDYQTLEAPDQVCNNNVTISIRGVGHFTYLGADRKTRSDRIGASFLQDIQEGEKGS